MARKVPTEKPPEQVTVAEVVRMLENLEWYCRRARLLLKQLDKKTPVKLTRELKAMATQGPPNVKGSMC